MNTNNLELGIAIANASGEINSRLIYDVLESELKREFGSEVCIDRKDLVKKQGLHAASVDFVVQFISENSDMLIDFVKVARIFWKLNNTHKKSQQEENSSIVFAMMDMNNTDSNLMLGKEYTEKDYINGIVDQFSYNDKKS